MKRLKITFIIVNSLAVVGVIAFVILSSIAMELDMKCTLVEKLHLYCPGCGGTRALYSLLRLDIISSLRYNIAVPFGAFVYIFYDIKAIIALAKRDEQFFSKQKFILIYAFIGILLLNFIVRNILLLGYGIDFIGDILPR
ncbi:MAG: DUF2752 domain-containing protein [Clostridia bacterium]|nr:DUF2752 domain-containing protein [Clostridia bacterium]MBR2297200.1 DUF2752 domain-containing protein [Clostridia bacterium]